MKREPGILQQRVEALPFQRRRMEAQKRIGGKQQEGEKPDPDQPLNGEDAGAQAGG